MSSMVIVQAAEGRTVFVPNSHPPSKIPHNRPIQVPLTATVLRAILSGDLIEFKQIPQTVEEPTPVVVKPKLKPRLPEESE